MNETSLQLGEAADEADWRTLVERGLNGAPWARLVGTTADGVDIQPLYREPDQHTAQDISGFPGAAPFIRGADVGGWRIRQSYTHPDPVQTNAEILADLKGGVAAIELKVDPHGVHGVAIRNSHDLDVALADVILEAAPVSLDAGAHGLGAATWLETKLKGVAAPGTAFNIDPLGAWMREGLHDDAAIREAAAFATRLRKVLPNAATIRIDARPPHEAGASEAQEIAVALASGVTYLRALGEAGLRPGEANSALRFAVAVGPDVLIETAKLRALRLCWARALEASGTASGDRGTHIHAFTSRRMMTRYDAWTNVLRVTTAGFAAAIGGAQEITTLPFTDALGLPTAFARRLARNTQHVLLEECRLGHVADPAGGAWFVEKITRDLATKAWEIFQDIESQGGIVTALRSGHLAALIGNARQARQQMIARRRETITGVTDYPLLDAPLPHFAPAPTASPAGALLAPIRWAEPFETLRDRAETIKPRPAVFFANLGALAEFGQRAQWTRNLFAAGGIGAIGAEAAHTAMEALIDAFRGAHAKAAVITGTDARYAEHAENCAQRLKAAGADWVLLAGKPGELEAKLRAAGIDQFVLAGADALKDIETLQAALGVSA